MQAIKEKLKDRSEMRKVKAEAMEEEKMHKDLAKTRAEVAHEIRLAKEAQCAMDLHVNKAVEKAQKHEAKYLSNPAQISPAAGDSMDPCGYSSSSCAPAGYSNAGITKATGADSGTGNDGSNTTTGIRGWFGQK